MLTKNAFKSLVKQCLAEVIVEGEKSTCQKCKGQGGYFTNIRNGSRLNNHWVSCDQPGCHNGIVDHEESYHALTGKGKCSGGCCNESDAPQTQWKDTFGKKMAGEYIVGESGESEDPRDAMYVEYVEQMPNEVPFTLRTPNGQEKFEYVKAKYPNGKIDIAVYAFRGDMVYGYQAFRKMMNIQENKNTKTISFIKECVSEVLNEGLFDKVKSAIGIKSTPCEHDWALVNTHHHEWNPDHDDGHSIPLDSAIEKASDPTNISHWQLKRLRGWITKGLDAVRIDIANYKCKKCKTSTNIECYCNPFKSTKTEPEFAEGFDPLSQGPRGVDDTGNPYMKWNSDMRKMEENEITETEGRICNSCNGSGEGMADGTKCSSCGGSGNADKKWGKKSKEKDFGDNYPDDREDAARNWGGMDE